MKYVELLSRIKPGTSPYVGNMQNSGDKKLSVKDQAKRDAGKKSRCLCCRGRKRVKAPAQLAGQPAKWEVCPRCFGSGRYMEGSQRGTRASMKPESTPHDMIAGLTLGMEQHWYRAAVVYATHDLAATDALTEDIRGQLVLPISDTWTLSRDVKRIRTLGIARVAARNLHLPLRSRIGGSQGALIMCCSNSSWSDHWAEPANYVSQRVFGWVKLANDHMRDMHDNSLQEIA